MAMTADLARFIPRRIDLVGLLLKDIILPQRQETTVIVVWRTMKRDHPGFSMAILFHGKRIIPP